MVDIHNVKSINHLNVVQGINEDKYPCTNQMK